MQKTLGKRFISGLTAAFMALLNLNGPPGMYETFAAESDYHVNVNVYNYDGKTKAPLEGKEESKYLALATLTDKGNAESIQGWALEYFDLKGLDNAKIDFKEFHPYGTDGSSITESTFKYDDSKYDIGVRIYTTKQSDYSKYSEVIDATKSGNASDVIPDYRFAKEESTDPNTLNLALIKDIVFYSVTIEANEAVNFKPENYLYLFVTATHQNSTAYSLQPVVFSGKSTTIQIQDDMNSTWTDNNNAPGDRYHGSDTEKLEVKLITARQARNLNNILSNSECTALNDGDVFDGFTVKYEDLLKSTDPDTHATKYSHKITLNRGEVSSDYNYKSILGDSLLFGITADRFYKKMHAETNFAANYYQQGEASVEPDLSGSYGGDFYIPNFVDFNGKTVVDSETKFLTADEEGGKINFGANCCEKGTTLHVDSENRVLHEREYVTFKVEDPESMTKNVINPMLDRCKTISDALAAKGRPYWTQPDEVQSVDTTSYPANATIYVNGDKMVEYAGGSSLDKKVTFKIREGQTIVVNFKDARDELTIGQYDVVYLDANNNESTHSSAPSGSNGDDQNKWLNKLTRQIVWNLHDVKKTTLQNTAGIFLNPNEDSEIYIPNTSTGWIVSRGYVENNGDEWHFVYDEWDATPETPDVPTTVTISKTNITGTEQLKGAVLEITGTIGDTDKIQVKQKDGSVPEDLSVTADKVHFKTGGQNVNITGLSDGQYTLTEITAPDGYEVAESMTFEIKDGKVLDSDGKDYPEKTVTMKDAPKPTKQDAEFSKRDVSGEEIADAHLRVFENGSSTNIDEWDSVAGQSHKIAGQFESGKTYVLEETSAPAGFQIADRLYFQVDNYGKVFVSSSADGNFLTANENKVIMTDKASVVKISKIDASTSEQLEGATLEIKPQGTTKIDKTKVKVTDSNNRNRGQDHLCDR